MMAATIGVVPGVRVAPDHDPGHPRAQHAVRRTAGAATASSARSSSAATARSSGRRARRPARTERAVTRPMTLAAPATGRPTLAVWKFASCDGCQLSLLDCEDELLAVAERIDDRLLPRGIERASSTARTTCRSSRGRSPRPHDLERIQRDPRAVAACSSRSAPAPPRGGIQALRNGADVDEFIGDRLRPPRVHLDARDVDADRRPRRRSTSSSAAARSTAGNSSRSISAYLTGRPPRIPTTSVCMRVQGAGRSRASWSPTAPRASDR